MKKMPDFGDLVQVKKNTKDTAYAGKEGKVLFSSANTSDMITVEFADGINSAFFLHELKKVKK